ncbi:piggyBac transposable element-derived protein 2 [Trichonephila clavipes]|nr:piggyBac transposable element-derived protein 2 [Trichonephila clavipes]
MDSIGHSSFPPTTLGRQDDEEATPGVFKMSRKKVFKTAEEAVEYLFSEELESEMIALPPEIDEVTDEEGFDNTETLDSSKWGIFDKHLSVDEMMIRYYGHHYFKQYIKGKPIRFGYKMWALCGNNGYCSNFDLYCGKEVADAASTVVLSKEALGTRVVKKMLQPVTDPKSHSLF